MTTDTGLSLWFVRSGNPAWGLFGGRDGAPPEVVINLGSPRETPCLKTNRMPLRKGDTVRCYRRRRRLRQPPGKTPKPSKPTSPTATSPPDAKRRN